MGSKAVLVIFTIEQINDLHARLGSAKTLPEYVRALKALGVERYDSYLADGHSEYFGQGGHRVVSPPVHEVLAVAETGQRETFLQHLCGKIRQIKAFHTGREAKEFLISKIVAEAESENVLLSDIERKMLYFTESGWTLPDMMEVNEDFDREYDQAEYERKIAKVVKKADKRLRKSPREDYDRWWAAIRFLQREDHYISVMIGLAGLRPRGDQLRLFATALAIVVCIVVWIFVSIKYNIPMLSRGSLGIFAWAVVGCLFVAYMLLRFILGRKRADDLTSKALEKIVRIYQSD